MYSFRSLFRYSNDDYFTGLSFRQILCLALLAFVTVRMVQGAESPADADLQSVIRQFRAFYLEPENPFAMRDSNEPAPDLVSSYRFAQSLRDDGTWADLAYTGDARSGWPPSVHYARMTAMATTAMRDRTSAVERTALLAATHRAFAYWIARDFQCLNWWYNEIGTPKTIGLCALLLGDQLTPAERSYVVDTLLPRSSIRLTGQNKVWLAGNTLMRGLLKGDGDLVGEATNAIWSEVIVTTNEGIQPDYSFHQHGAQQQFGNYGMAFAVEAARWGRILRSTRWQLPASKLSIVRHYLLDGQAWVSWRGAMDISACGRQLMPRSPRQKTSNLMRVMEQAVLFDPDQAADYRAFVLRNHPDVANDLVGNRYFWRSDYMIHRTPGFAATLKLSSRRVIGAELVNDENLSGYHTADGCLYLYRTGDEYEDIFPVWDWRKLPGVTCAQGELPSFRTSFVDRDFVGGISNGSDGVCVLDYVRDGVQAKKSWFFSGDVVVCLGADISGPPSAPLVTTLNQCLLRGPVSVQSASQEQTITSKNLQLRNADFIEHDGWRYTLLESADLHLETGPVTGNWHRVFNNPDSPAADVSRELFTVWIDHGHEPKGARYGYAIAPISSEQHFQVLENSSTIQAVRLGDSTVGVAFWAPGSIKLPGSRQVAVDQPCLLLITAENVAVVDPTQKLKEVRLNVDGVMRVAELPQGELAGTAAHLK